MDLQFERSFIERLPADPQTGPRRRQVHGALYSRIEPTPVAAPRLIAHSREVAALLGIDPAAFVKPTFAEVFGGNALLEGMAPYAANYGGHQFGHWAGQLGDGRAITLGERIGTDGVRYELQLKGAGPTPYSRTADGRAVLRSSIREFLCSEAMYHLGVPTTRALSLVATGEDVIRDMFYDGHARPEPGAVVCRVSPSFLRFGNFELPTSRRDVALLTQLVDFTIDSFYPGCSRDAWFAAVCERTAIMVAHWMRVGFVHGVMNTDNMSILGLTIDYGPYGWIDDFDPDWTPNTTDRQQRRYRFGQQPQIAYWNLACLANALMPAFDNDEARLQAALERYVETFNARSRANAAAKLGLAPTGGEAELELIHALYGLMKTGEVDMTIFFRLLADLNVEAPDAAVFVEAFYDEAKRASIASDLDAWLARYAARVRADALDPAKRRADMHRANPKYVLRNCLAQEAIDRAEAGDDGGVHELLDLLRRPYDEQPGRERFAARRPDWARDRAGCSMLS